MKGLSGVSRTAAVSIGNMGSSMSLCSPVNLGVDNNVIACASGKIAYIHSMGIHPRERKSNENEAVSDLDIPSINPSKGIHCVNHPDDTCNKYLDLDRMNETISEQCIGKEVCKFSNFKSFFKSDLTLRRGNNY